MTAKRFKVEKNEKWICILDRGKSIGNLYDVCECLNTLHEENIQLKERNEFLKKQLDRVCIDNEEMGDKLKKIGRIL